MFASLRTQPPTSILMHSRIQVFEWCFCQQSISQLYIKFIFKEKKSLLCGRKWILGYFTKILFTKIRSVKTNLSNVFVVNVFVKILQTIAKKAVKLICHLRTWYKKAKNTKK